MPVSRTRRPPTAVLAAALLAAVGLAPGCAAYTAWLVGQSEAETDEILGDLETQVDEERREARESEEPASDIEVHRPEIPDVMTLDDAQRIAHEYNRDLRRDREGLVLSAIALRNAQRDVGPRLASSVSAMLGGTEDGEDVRTDSGALSLTDLLPTGAEATVSGDASRTYGRGMMVDASAGGAVTAGVSQPLLAGAGYESSHEALTDAEREALYDVRSFELSRQDLALRVQQEFYALVAQKQVIRNREQTLEQFEFLKRRSERLFEVDRVSEVDKFRATREFLSAQNDLVDARQEYANRLDRFKVLLGFDTTVEFEVADEIPETTMREFELEDALAAALRNRLDLMNARGRVEDSERRLRNRERDALPALDVEATWTRSNSGRRHVTDLDYDDNAFAVGVSLELPLDRVRERGAIRSARIELARARRDLSLLTDTVLREVRESLRSYRSAANSVAIQRQIVASEEKNAKVARIRFEDGEISNRDLTDAQNGLADAKDRLVRETANLADAKMQLIRDVGILTLHEDGTWKLPES